MRCISISNGTLKDIGVNCSSFLYIGLLCYLSFIKADELGDIYRRSGIQGDDLLHVLAFTILGFFLLAAFSSSLYSRWLKTPMTWSVFSSLAIAVIIELLQTGMPTRHASIIDLALHALGIAVFFAISACIKKLRSRASKISASHA